VILLAALAIGAAVSPAAAAPSLAELDRNALVLIGAFGVRLVAVVFEVWRLTLRNDTPINSLSMRKPKQK
jgi:hypothetical protein